MEDVFAIQGEISLAVVQSLKVKLLGKKSEPLVKDYTKNAEAYELYLKGCFHENKGPVGFDKDIEYFEKAVKADPNYVPAYLKMAGINHLKMHAGSSPPWEIKPKVDYLLRKALEIDDSYCGLYAVLGTNKLFDFDWHEAEKTYKRGIEINYPAAELRGILLIKKCFYCIRQ